MKKLFFFFFCFWTVVAHAQTIGSQPAFVQQKALFGIQIDSSYQVGTIYDSSSWNNLISYTVTGGSPSITSGRIVMPASTKIVWTTNTMFDQETHQVDLKYTNIVTTDSGTEIGWSPTNTTNPIGMVMSLNLSNRKVYFYEIVGGTPAQPYVSSTALSSLSAGDSLSFIIQKNAGGSGLCSATVIDWTTGSTASVSTIDHFSYAGGTGLLRNSGSISIYNRATSTTSFTVYRDYYHSDAPKNPVAVLMSNSIGNGSYAGALPYRFANINGFVSWSGPADVSADGVRTVAALIKYVHPVNVFMAYWGNDIAYSVPSGTWQANMKGIHDTLVAHGINVIWLYSAPWNYGGLDVTPINTWINANYPGQWIDTYTPLWSGSGTTMNPAYISPDGIHPNSAGHAVIGATIDTSRLYWAISNAVYLKARGAYAYTSSLSGVMDSTAYVTWRDLIRQATIFSTINPPINLGGYFTTANINAYQQGDLGFNSYNNDNTNIYTNASNNGGEHFINNGGAVKIQTGINFAGTGVGALIINAANGGTAGNPISWNSGIVFKGDGTVGFDATNVVPTSYCHFRASDANYSSARFQAGSAPSSPNDGDIYNLSSTHHLYVYLNGTQYQLDQQSGSGSSGMYLPTITAGVNVSSVTADSLSYIKSGHIVHVTGSITVTTTTGASASQLTISPPTGFTANLHNMAGICFYQGSVPVVGVIAGSSGNALVGWTTSTTTGSQSMVIDFQYRDN